MGLCADSWLGRTYGRFIEEFDWYADRAGHDGDLEEFGVQLRECAKIARERRVAVASCSKYHAIKKLKL